MIAPCKNSWSLSDSQPLTLAYSSATHSFPRCCLNITGSFFKNQHTNLLSLSFSVIDIFEYYICYVTTAAPALLSLVQSLFCSDSPLPAPLYPLAVLAKQGPDNTVLNNVICQHAQPESSTSKGDRMRETNRQRERESMNACMCVYSRKYRFCESACFACVHMFKCRYWCVNSSMCNLLKCGSDNTERVN